MGGVEVAKSVAKDRREEEHSSGSSSRRPDDERRTRGRKGGAPYPQEERWPRKEFRRSCRTCKRIRQRLAARVQPERISSTGRRPSWDPKTVLTREECSS